MLKRTKGLDHNSSSPAKAAKKDKNAGVVDYDSDQEPSSESAFSLDWRLSPQQSLSDWTIRIHLLPREEKCIESSYHVHKCILAIGCDYFARLFRGGDGNDLRFAEYKDAVSEIELHPLSAEAFPAFLDYLYNGAKGLQIETKTATALHYLGKYLGHERLRWEAKTFWCKDITAGTFATYYEHAKIFHDVKVLQAVTDFCGSNSMKITADSRIIKISDPQLWLDILKSANKHHPETLPCYLKPRRKHLSILVSKFCWEHEDVDVDTFSELTKEENLPEIDCKAALELLAAEERCSTSAQESPGSTKKTELQQRCLTALAGHWHEIDLSKNVVSSLNPRLLTEILLVAQFQLKTERKKRTRLPCAHRPCAHI